MKWVTRIVGAGAIFVTAVWACSFIWAAHIVPLWGTWLTVERGCYGIAYLELSKQEKERLRGDSDATQTAKGPYEFIRLRPAEGALLLLPSYEVMPAGHGTAAKFHIIEIPHWLTNLVAWSLFFFFWRKARKPPTGHCQQCGYDLTGNESGACPECNTAVADVPSSA